MEMKSISFRDDTPPEDVIKTILRVICEHAGGRFVGVQAPAHEGRSHLCLFQAPCGSTCALPLDNNFSTATIRRKIREKQAEFLADAPTAALQDTLSKLTTQATFLRNSEPRRLLDLDQVESEIDAVRLAIRSRDERGFIAA